MAPVPTLAGSAIRPVVTIFNGSSNQIQIADHALLDITKSLTLCAWVKPEVLSSDRKIIAKFPQDAYQLNILNYKPTIQVNGSDVYGWNSCSANDSLPLNEWSFICGVYDYNSSLLKIYVNGQLENSVVVSGEINTSNAPVVIGNYHGGYQHFKGNIDDVRIYNRAINEDEIMALYTVEDSVNHLVADYSFKGNARDGSIYANHGKVTGASLDSSRFGEHLGCYYFDGIFDDITIDTSSSLDITESLTLCAWINPAELGNNGKILTKVSDGNGYQLTMHNKKVSFQIKGDNATWSVCNSNKMLPFKHWTFVCGTYDYTNSIMKLYVNGELNSTFPLAGNITQSDAPVVIGNIYGGNQKFKGKIDDVKIYSRAISEGEVKDLYGNWHAEYQTNEPEGLVAAYPFSGNANDESAYANHGKTDGATLSSDRFENENSCFSFDGTNDEITIDTSTSLNIRKSLSLCAWINPTQLGSDNNIISKFPDGNAIQLAVLNKKASFQLGDGGVNWIGCNSTDIVPLNKWTFICGVYDYDSSLIKIYINGELNDSVEFSDSIPAGNTPIVIGNYFGGNSRFKGKIDDVLIYNKAISQKEIDNLYANWHELYDAPDPEPLPGPVAKYYFNGNANNESDSVNHGVVNGAILDTNRFGIPNACYNFDGSNDDITIENDSTLDITKSLTLCAWINPATLGNDEKILTKISDGNGYQLTIYNKKVSFQVKGDFATWSVCNSNEIIPTNQWTFVCGTYDYTDGSMKFYVNGVLNSTFPLVGNITQSDAPVVIGNAYGENQRFNGKIDDVIIYNRAISEEEILELYNWQEVVQPEEGLVARYYFNGNANDGSGNGLNGTILGGVTLDTNRHGELASCYHFNGDKSEIQVPDNDLLDITESLTICAWINPSKMGSDNKIVTKFPSDAYQLNLYQHKATFQISQQEGSVYSWRTCSSSDTIPINAWSFICGVYDYQNEEMKIYVNGELKNTIAVSGNINATNAPLVIGNFNIKEGWYRFNGKIDDVRIYNRAINEDEIIALYYENDTVNLPVANYLFNGNSNDESIYENHGTIDGATLDTNRFGEPNSCYNFDGTNDEITIENDSTLDITESFTICAWISPDELNNNATILSKVAEDKGYQLSIFDKKVNFKITLEGANWNAVCYSKKMIPVKNWTFVCGTFDYANNKMKFYVNGELNSSLNLLGKVTRSDNPVVIGNAYGENRNFNGKIDDVKIYRRAISQDEVKTLYGNWHAVYQTNEPEGLVAKYNFNGNAYDESIYANHGKINGARLSTNRFDKENSCYNFDGIDDEITIDTSSSLNIEKSLSLCAWIKPTQLDTNNKIVTKFSNDNGFQLTMLNKKASFQIGAGEWLECNSTDTLPLNKWTFICGVYDYDSSVVKIYINGELSDSVEFSDSIPSNSAPVVIGNYFEGNQRFNGIIDDVLIYNKAINQDEIKSLYGNWHSISVKTHNEKDMLKVYPNPADEMLTIENLIGKNNIQIFSTTGQLVYNTQTGNSAESIDVANLLSGIYILVVTNNHSESLVEKVVIK